MYSIFLPVTHCFQVTCSDWRPPPWGSTGQASGRDLESLPCGWADYWCRSHGGSVPSPAAGTGATLGQGFPDLAEKIEVTKLVWLEKNHNHRKVVLKSYFSAKL